MTETEHKFGGIWTKKKLDALQQYLGAYTTAMKNQQFKLFYIDAFAGSGAVTIRDHMADSSTKKIPGSAAIALNEDGFDEYWFWEPDTNRHAQLMQLITEHGKESISHAENRKFSTQDTLKAMNRWNHRGVLFIDPYGMEMGFDDLIRLAETEKLDIWYLFPLSGIYRQAAKDISAVDDGKKAALRHCFGDDWEDRLYRRSSQMSLFDVDTQQERIPPYDICDNFKAKLLEHFADADYRILRGANNAPLFALFFMVSNKKGASIAMKIAGHILKSI